MKTKIIGGLLALPLFILITIGTLGSLLLLDAYVLRDLWKWFIVPIFTSLPVLTFYGAAGLSIFHQGLAFKAESESGTKGLYLNHIVGVALIWVIGDIVHRIWG